MLSVLHFRIPVVFRIGNPALLTNPAARYIRRDERHSAVFTDDHMVSEINLFLTVVADTPVCVFRFLVHHTAASLARLVVGAVVMAAVLIAKMLQILQ